MYSLPSIVSLLHQCLHLVESATTACNSGSYDQCYKSENQDASTLESFTIDTTIISSLCYDPFIELYSYSVWTLSPQPAQVITIKYIADGGLADYNESQSNFLSQSDDSFQTCDTSLCSWGQVFLFDSDIYQNSNKEIAYITSSLEIDIISLEGFLNPGNWFWQLYCYDNSPSPTSSPTKIPTPVPTDIPTAIPSIEPTYIPSKYPTHSPTAKPTKPPLVPDSPTEQPSVRPTTLPSLIPSPEPSGAPTDPSNPPTSTPTNLPSGIPTFEPSTMIPTSNPTVKPSFYPTVSVITSEIMDAYDSTTIVNIVTSDEKDDIDDGNDSSFSNDSEILIWILVSISSLLLLTLILVLICTFRLKKKHEQCASDHANVLKTENSRVKLGSANHDHSQNINNIPRDNGVSSVPPNVVIMRAHGSESAVNIINGDVGGSREKIYLDLVAQHDHDDNNNGDIHANIAIDGLEGADVVINDNKNGDGQRGEERVERVYQENHRENGIVLSDHDESDDDIEALFQNEGNNENETENAITQGKNEYQDDIDNIPKKTVIDKKTKIGDAALKP